MSETDTQLFEIHPKPTIDYVPDNENQRIIIAQFHIRGGLLSGDLRVFLLKNIRVRIVTTENQSEYFFCEDVYKKVHNGAEDEETFIGFALRKMKPTDCNQFSNEQLHEKLFRRYFKKGAPEQFELRQNYNAK